jgi:adenine-specific DNA methylase
MHQHLSPKPFIFPSEDRAEKLHSLFRYPAKFHAPIAKELVQLFSSKGDTVLDPFCGSGTLLLEAKLAGRHSVGVDIDPLAAFISKVKTSNWLRADVSAFAAVLLEKMAAIARSDDVYQKLSKKDISATAYSREVRDNQLWIPELPRIEHWFRRYVIVDLAKTLALIKTEIPGNIKDFFLLSFASAIRACSNADPVPVSGLEVTSHMRQKDALGRVVNPIELVSKSIKKSLLALDESPISQSRCEVINGDATELSKVLSSLQVTACVTSPPYHGAVDYYRRHTLEMYWLQLVQDHDERLTIRPRYIGHGKVAKSHAFLTEDFSSPMLKDWESRMRQIKPERADAFRHYMVAMGKTFNELAEVLPSGAPAVFVVGQSQWNGAELPTSMLLAELAQEKFKFAEHFWYPLKNRYMSYSRHNGADIDKEFVAVFTRK